ncbi:substrate-binding domain-containing protein [Onishia taeanensis]
MTTIKTSIAALLAATALSSTAMVSTATADDHATSACLITKTETNPFFVKMREGAAAKADALGIELKSFAGRIDGDHKTQVEAIETCIADGADGILLTASDTSAIVSAVQQARDAGILVIALDTPLNPTEAADATFATDNFRAGELIGAWAAGQLGTDASNARIGLLNVNVSQPAVGVLRNQGFLQGFGIDINDPNKWGDETDPRIVGQDISDGNEEGGREGMENLLVEDPMINVVYTVNEPAAAGAYQALKSMGRENEVLVVSVDGSCSGVANVKDGVIGATAQQYPLRMASLGIEAIQAWADEGIKPEPTPGKNFFDTGVSLVTNEPTEEVDSISVEEGLERCWG